MNIEQGLRIENENLKRLLEEVERERDEALAYGERLRGYLIQCSIFATTYKIYSIRNTALAEQPPAALAALKAEWQAIGAANAVIAIEQDKSLRYMNAQIQPCTYPDCRCPLELPHKDSPCAIGRKKEPGDE